MNYETNITDDYKGVAQFVDPVVSRQKFEQELQNYHKVKTEYLKDGVILLDAVFPNIYFAFTTPLLTPVAIAFAVCINFDNYDLKPLSVQFVHPLTYTPLYKSQLLTLLPRKIKQADGTVQFQELVQADLNNVPFFCIPGVREYHEHVAHTGDHWLKYRGTKQDGTLCFIIEKLLEYGTGSITAFKWQLNLGLVSPQLSLNYDTNKIVE